jgi:rRNA maturation protein Nop10
MEFEDPYVKHRRMCDLAWRLLHHEARTHTVAEWTGLSERRVRGLLRRYGSPQGDAKLKRPRGQAPYRIDQVLRSPRKRLEAAIFAQNCVRYGAVDPLKVGARTSLPDIRRGELICSAYEALKRDIPSPTLKIEEGMLLVTTLASSQEYALEKCSHCGGPVLRDRLALTPNQCETCGPMLCPA